MAGAGCCLPGRKCCSGWSELTLSAELLPNEIIPTGNTVQLHVALFLPDETEPRQALLALEKNADGNWQLSQSDIFEQGGCPTEATMIFSLIIDGQDTELTPLEATVHPDCGGNETVLLWEGWTLTLDWGGWVV